MRLEERLVQSSLAVSEIIGMLRAYRRCSTENSEVCTLEMLIDDIERMLREHELLPEENKK